MFRFSNLRIRFKLIILFIITGSIPLVIVGFSGSRLATEALLNKSFDQLTTVQTIRKNQIEEYFKDRFTGIQVMAEAKRVKELLKVLKAQRAQARKGSTLGLDTRSAAYWRRVRPFSRMMESYAEAYGYHDIFVVDAEEGDVLYSVAGEDDLGSNLRYGAFKGTGLAKVWRTVIGTGKIAISDFEPFSPSNNKEALFIGYPIHTGENEVSGVLIFQFTPDQVTHILDARKGMGETGESYLLGIESEGGGRYEFRSNMRTIGDGSYVVGSSLDEPLAYWRDAVSADLEGGDATYVDSVGKTVLVAYNRLDIAGLKWYLISKIDKFEVTAPIRHIYRIIAMVAGGLFLFIGVVAVLLSRTITHPLLEGMHFAQTIASGDFSSSLSSIRKDELGDLVRALNNMAGNLRNLDWLKTGKEGLDDTLRGDHQLESLGRRFVTYMARHMDAQVGALYLMNEGVLELKSSYAFTDRHGNFNRISLGEGMVGQAALEDEVLMFSALEGEAPVFNFGAAETALPHFMAVPMAFEGEVTGVLLLGSTASFNPLQKRFVEESRGNVAILFNAARSRHLVNELLEKARSQQDSLQRSNEELESQALALKASEAELQAQQEELRVTNEELEEQTHALRESEGELQAQQEELRVINEELEERTKDLEEQRETMLVQNTELQKAQEVVKEKAKDLEAASRYKSEFLANMSHELRTPLNSILILSQLLSRNREGNLTDKQVESAQAVHASGSDLLSLINEILDLSKIEAGKVDLFVEEVSMDRLVEDLKRHYDELSIQKGLRFSVAIDPSVPQVLHTDPQRLLQILRNLLTNAFKFTRQGGVSLSVFTPDATLLSAMDVNPEDAIAFAVKDDGIGIAKEKQAAIFKAFQQADGSTSRKYGGTGLGLSISKELTRILGGTIHLESDEGKGSTFTVVVPKVHGGALPERAPMEAPVDSTVSVATGDEPLVSTPEESAVEPHPSEECFVGDDRKSFTEGAKTLLIIDDDENSARIMRDFARERGFLCVVAGDGETGLHYADYHRPSAIILDIGLPGIDGWTVMERLKENSELRHIPVHFMSGSDSALDAMRMGAVGYLTKPVSMEKVDEAFSRMEEIIEKPVSRLLLVEDDKVHQESIKALIGNGDVETTAVSTGAQALEELIRGGYDCMVLDLGLTDMTGFELLEKIRSSETAARVPIIIYTGRDLTLEEERELNRYAESIIVKGVKSPERLLDESALFLHRVEANLPEEKRRMIKMVHDKEAVLARKRILLVDDDMRNLFALSSILEERGMEVVIARNGVECLEKLKEGPSVDGVLMDIMMPEMDGYEAMRRIRKEKMYLNLPIIALTAKAMKGDRSKCIEAGASDYLAKPVNTEKLLSMLRVWLY